MTKVQYFKTVLMACAIAFIILWYLEFQRTDLMESYWLLLAALASFMGYQYIRVTNMTDAKKAEIIHKIQNSPNKVNKPKAAKKKK